MHIELIVFLKFLKLLETFCSENDKPLSLLYLDKVISIIIDTILNNTIF